MEPINSNQGSRSPEELKGAVLRFLADFTIETTPHSAHELVHFPEYLAAGTTVYVAHPPKCSFAGVIELALRLRRLGYRPVPHLVARRIESRLRLEDALKHLQDAGIDQALIVAGDLAEPLGPYNNTMQILETGLLPQHGFLTVGVAGHPEGSRAVGATKLRQALREKAQFAAETGLYMYVVTQFGFNAEALPAWESMIRRDGIDLPIHVGMAGRAPLKELLRYAFRCGVSASMRMLVSKASTMSEQIRLTSMDELILAFARYRLSHPDSRIARAHFFAFGSAERTARWLKTVLSGGFEISPDAMSIRLIE